MSSSTPSPRPAPAPAAGGTELTDEQIDRLVPCMGTNRLVAELVMNDPDYWAPYSDDIGWAWKVVRAVRGELLATVPAAEDVDFYVSEEGGRYPTYTASIRVNGGCVPGGYGQCHELGGWDAMATESPALAVCRCALKAVLAEARRRRGAGPGGAP